MDGWSIESERRAPVRQIRRDWGRRAGAVLLFLVVAASFYVKSEPGKNQPVPFDLMMIGCMGLFFLLGLRFPRGLGWPAALLGLLIAGYGIGGLDAPYMDRVQSFLPVTAYLVCSLIFFASYVYEDAERHLELLFRAYTLAALIAATFGVGGYFGLIPNAGTFLNYGRATGTFNDPNVFGPFLIAPALYLSLKLSTARPAAVLGLLPPLVLLLLGILLSFSRGAWGNFVLSSVVFFGLTLASSRSERQTFRLLAFCVFMGLLVMAVLGVALSTPKVAALFAERATLVQDYDVSQHGRFESQTSAFLMALEHPLGLGPAQWSKINNLDTHNVYLNILVAGGFLSGLSFLVFAGLTLRQGWRAAFSGGPGHSLFIVAYACLAGHLAEAFIIDVGNWRHLFLLFGMAWGGILAAQGAIGAHAGRAAGGMDGGPEAFRF